MVKVIMGTRGTGKTKKIIELVNDAINVESGNVVCVEKGQHLRFNIKYNAKLVDISEYPMKLGYDNLLAFVCGLYSGDYDITHIFIDSLYKITGDDDDEKAVCFLNKLEEFSNLSGVKFTLTISAENENAPEGVRKYF